VCGGLSGDLLGFESATDTGVEGVDLNALLDAQVEAETSNSRRFEMG
jgi:hypothetical protein